MVSDAQREADRKSKKKNTRLFAVRFTLSSEGDLWRHLQEQPNKAGYVKALIREDMEGSA